MRGQRHVIHVGGSTGTHTGIIYKEEKGRQALSCLYRPGQRHIALMSTPYLGLSLAEMLCAHISSTASGHSRNQLIILKGLVSATDNTVWTRQQRQKWWISICCASPGTWPLPPCQAAKTLTISGPDTRPTRISRNARCDHMGRKSKA